MLKKYQTKSTPVVLEYFTNRQLNVTPTHFLFCSHRLKKTRKKLKPQCQLFYRRKHKQAEILQEPQPTDGLVTAVGPGPAWKGATREGPSTTPGTGHGGSSGVSVRHPRSKLRGTVSVAGHSAIRLSARDAEPRSTGFETCLRSSPCPRLHAPHLQGPVVHHGLDTVTGKFQKAAIPEL